MSAKPRIALIHATPVAVAPIQAAFAELWPQAEPAGVLDDTLAIDRAKSEAITPAIAGRIMDLARYGLSLGADAVLFTCSAFGSAIEAAARELPIPVLKPNEAMFEEALQRGSRIGMVATFAPAVAMMEQEFAEAAAAIRPGATLTTNLAQGAIEALRSGDDATHNELVARQAVALADCDAVILAHFSTSRALAACRERLPIPILSSPDAAVRKLRRLIETHG